MSAFIISYLLWNWELVFVTLSGVSWDSKVLYINRMTDWIKDGSFVFENIGRLLIPIVISTVYVFLWPYIDRIIILEIRRIENGTKEKKLEVDNAEIISEEEAHKLRIDLEEAENKIRKIKKENRDNLENEKRINTTLSEKNAELHKRLTKITIIAEDAESNLKKLKKEHEELRKDSLDEGKYLKLKEVNIDLRKRVDELSFRNNVSDINNEKNLSESEKKEKLIKEIRKKELEEKIINISRGIEDGHILEDYNNKAYALNQTGLDMFELAKNNWNENFTYVENSLRNEFGLFFMDKVVIEGKLETEKHFELKECLGSMTDYGFLSSVGEISEYNEAIVYKITSKFVEVSDKKTEQNLEEEIR